MLRCGAYTGSVAKREQARITDASYLLLAKVARRREPAPTLIGPQRGMSPDVRYAAASGNCVSKLSSLRSPAVIASGSFGQTRDEHAARELASLARQREELGEFRLNGSMRWAGRSHPDGFAVHEPPTAPPRLFPDEELLHAHRRRHLGSALTPCINSPSAGLSYRKPSRAAPISLTRPRYPWRWRAPPSPRARAFRSARPGDRSGLRKSPRRRSPSALRR